MENYAVHNVRKNPFLFGLKITGMVVLGIIGITSLAFLFGYVVMLLWNWLMPDLFSLTTITFWQAVGIVLLARLIFGGFKHFPGSHSHKSKHFKKKDQQNEVANPCASKWTKWKYYDKFWQEKGQEAFDEYVSHYSDEQKSTES